MRRPSRRYKRGAAYQLRQAEANLKRTAGASETAQFDAQDFYQKASAAYAKAQERLNRQEPTWVTKVGQAVSTSRVSFGKGGLPQLAPLVNRLGDVIGAAGAAAGPFGLALTAGTSALTALTQAVNASASALNQFGSEMGRAGATTGETARFAAITGSPADFAARAEELQRRRSTDMFAAGAAGYTLPRPFGAVDEGAALIRELNNLRSLNPDPAAQLQRARVLGLEWALESVRVSEDVWRAKMREAEAHALVANPENAAAARDFAAWQTLIGQQFQDLQTTLTLPAMKEASKALSTFNESLRTTTTLLQLAGQGMDQAGAAAQNAAVQAGGRFGVSEEDARLWGRTTADVWKGVMRRDPLAIYGAGERAVREIRERQPAGKPGDPAAAQDANTKAIMDLTATLRDVTGGGERARRAVPAALLSSINRTTLLNGGIDLRGYRGL